LAWRIIYKGQFNEAAASSQRACDLAKYDDSLVDCSNWLYVSLRRAGDKRPSRHWRALMQTPTTRNSIASSI
jgi:hypothetical protein